MTDETPTSIYGFPIIYTDEELNWDPANPPVIVGRPGKPFPSHVEPTHEEAAGPSRRLEDRGEPS